MRQCHRESGCSEITVATALSSCVPSAPRAAWKASRRRLTWPQRMLGRSNGCSSCSLLASSHCASSLSLATPRTWCAAAATAPAAATVPQPLLSVLIPYLIVRVSVPGVGEQDAANADEPGRICTDGRSSSRARQQRLRPHPDIRRERASRANLDSLCVSLALITVSHTFAARPSVLGVAAA